MTEDTTFGFDDEALATRPTVYQSGLFEGQVVMVSGAGSGIGKAIAFLYARLGAKLVICGRDPAKLESCAEWLRRLGSPDVLVHPMTIRDPEQVEQLIDVAWLHFGRIDVLVNNAGGQFPQRALDYSVKGWKAVIDTNLNGTWYMMHGAANRWVEQGRHGNIVNITAAN
ncbi:MAG: SDR family NAD(P)-dependent oxidoreductase, partial [Hydrogenophaga sp.]|nr:SDR family NAD(P)-dependent oxidoreductase [Hydrogenophaga sp.]